MKKIVLAAVLASTAIGGAAIAAQTAAPPPPPAPMMHHGHHGDWMARIDVNHDGVITRDEAMTAADAKFARYDTDGNGQITHQEMQAHMAARHDRMMARRGTDTPPSAGRDGGPMRGGPGMHPGGGMMMMRRMDTNHDGIISRDEAHAAAVAMFDKADTNHDGRIDQGEIAAAKAQMAQRRADMRARWQAQRADNPSDDAQQ